eukprot:CAMPEP_0185474468 /NCGR_PEP_ID=MMETSP1366-20130426/2037_1 /TAXON_ID=38817 /ORGANISM="Gephyrocapsa oceanica, Strain RCC1303" /LENGTH=331 /DNA_ID=CAMNT_0028081359 /DNA_START=13 /DNA_END=1004 /DNA_ORIENTATION=+
MAAFVADKSCVGAQDDEFCVAVSSLASPPPPRLLLRRGSPPPQSSSIASLGLSDREESHSPLGAGPGRDYRYARQAAEASLTEHVYSACRAGDAERLEAILAAAEADRSEEIGGIRALARECCLSPGLVVCCLRGRPRCLALLLAAGADPDASEAPPCVGRAGGFAPLRYACWGTTAGHVECAEMLLAAGAAVEAATAVGHTPLQGACFKGHLPTVRLLSSYGASRSFLLSDTAESVALRQGHGELAAWLAQSRHWTTPLHHLDSLSLARTRLLLRAGASLRAAAAGVANAPTPLSLARQSSSAAAALVVAAAEPWSPASHALWPERLQRL